MARMSGSRWDEMKLPTTSEEMGVGMEFNPEQFAERYPETTLQKMVRQTVEVVWSNKDKMTDQFAVTMLTGAVMTAYTEHNRALIKEDLKAALNVLSGTVRGIIIKQIPDPGYQSGVVEPLVEQIMHAVQSRYWSLWESASYFNSIVEGWRRKVEELELADDVTRAAEILTAGSLFVPSTVEHHVGEGVEFFSIPIKDIPRLVTDWITKLETANTEEMCRCTWRFHPDDIDKPEGERRKVRVDDHPECWVHTPEGRFLGFFEWLFPPSTEEDSPEDVTGRFGESEGPLGFIDSPQSGKD